MHGGINEQWIVMRIKCNHFHLPLHSITFYLLHRVPRLRLIDQCSRRNANRTHDAHNTRLN